MEIKFKTQIGDEIDVVVTGYYSAPDDSVGYQGQLDISTVCLEFDVLERDISSIIKLPEFESLEEKGACEAEKASREAKFDFNEE